MRLRCLLLSLALLAAAHSARAHLASDSYLRIETDAAGMIGGQWDIALRDLDFSQLDALWDAAKVEERTQLTRPEEVRR